MSVTDWLILIYMIAVAAGCLTCFGRGLIWWKPLLILFVLSTAGLFLYLPGHYTPNERLKPGLDLAGGTTLIYDVQMPDDANADRVINETISILKERVDPTGTKDLSWRQVAGNRIEIQMPLATAKTKERRQTFEQARQELLNDNLTKSQINAMLRMDGAQRQQKLTQLAGGNEKLKQQLTDLVDQHETLTTATEPYQQAQSQYRQARRTLGTDQFDADLIPSNAEQARRAFQQYQQARQELESLQQSDDAEEEAVEKARQRVDELKQQVLAPLKQRMLARTQAYVEAREAYDTTLNGILTRNIEPQELERILDLPSQAEGDAQTSPRQQAIDQLKQDHPSRSQQIERVAKAYNAYAEVRGPFDDREELMALLESSGVLEFRIAGTPQTQELSSEQIDKYRQQLQQRGPRGGQDQPWRWFAVDELEQFLPGGEDAAEQFRKQLKNTPDGEKDQFVSTFFRQSGYVGAYYGGEFYVLLGNTPSNGLTQQQEGWELASANPIQDQRGMRAVGFELNTVGGQMMGQLTGPHQGEPMAILLDNEVISAPNLQSQINDRGQITGGTGGFSRAEQQYLVRMLNAGSLQGQLKGPISIQTTGPQLGQDNLQAGFQASIWAIILVALVAAGYYFFGGLVADFALFANMVIILGVMAMIQATFTLPGIAGLVLTIGMAIDANVLIFERIREELERDAPVAQAIRTGYQKALSTVIDANLTTLITCVVLYYTATAEVKGFALVLGIGIVATLFTALFCTRVLLELWVTYGRSHRLTMLPSLVPAVRNALTPNVNWIGKRYGFFAVSAVLVLGGLLLVQARGKNMLDIEFRSGTEVTFSLKDEQTMSIQQVRQRLHEYGDVAQAIEEGTPRGELSGQQQQVFDRLNPIIDRINGQPANTPAQQAGPGASAADTGQDVDFSLFSEASIVTLGDAEGGKANSFSVSTLITHQEAVSSVVKAAFEDKLDAGKSRPVNFDGLKLESAAAAVNEKVLYPITRTNEQGQAILGLSINRPQVRNDVTDYLGGAAFVLRDLSQPLSVEDAQQRIDRMRMREDFQGLSYREFQVVGLDPVPEADGGAEPLYQSIAVLVHNNETNYADNPQRLTADGGLAATSWPLVKAAMQRDTSLGSVSQFSSQISATMQQQAIVAMSLALLAVVAYIWFRFGSLRYGLAAIVALVHDVTITLGLVAVTGWIYDTTIGTPLMLDPFKINLAMVAAMLTIVGYSLNDTIVVFDRIRENRGRLARASVGIINDSINQTISRTALTSGTTLIAVLTLYILGGGGVHGFAFAMIVGVMVGTYSSIAIAAPTLLIGSGGAGEGEASKQTGATTPTQQQPAGAAAASKA
jgi:SecD/SecF fusion protein